MSDNFNDHVGVHSTSYILVTVPMSIAAYTEHLMKNYPVQGHHDVDHRANTVEFTLDVDTACPNLQDLLIKAQIPMHFKVFSVEEHLEAHLYTRYHKEHGFQIKTIHPDQRYSLADKLLNLVDGLDQSDPISNIAELLETVKPWKFTPEDHLQASRLQLVAMVKP